MHAYIHILQCPIISGNYSISIIPYNKLLLLTSTRNYSQQLPFVLVNDETVRCKVDSVMTSG